MNITVSSKNLKPSPKLEAAIESKFKKLDKYFSNDTKAVIKLNEEKTGLAKLEANIYAGSLTFRAEESNSDLFYCLDKVIDKLSSQMSKLKGKLLKKHKDSKDIFISEIPDAESAADEGIVRIKDIELTAMTQEEAVLQMELLGHSFFAYADPDTGNTSIVYKRTNGGYGVLRTK